MSGTKFCKIPRPNCEAIRKRYESLTDADVSRICAEIDAKPRRDWRRFLLDWEKDPSLCTFLDVEMPYDEFKRRVEAGEFD